MFTVLGFYLKMANQVFNTYIYIGIWTPVSQVADKLEFKNCNTLKIVESKATHLSDVPGFGNTKLW